MAGLTRIGGFHSLHEVFEGSIHAFQDRIPEEEALSLTLAALAKNARVHLERDDLGGTPLHEAAQALNLGAVRALLEAGADPDARDGLGETPLLRATKGDESLFEVRLFGLVETGESDLDTSALEAVSGLLLGRGADPSAADRGGRTPLHSASALGLAGPCRLLVMAGADTDALDGSGRSIFDVCACERTGDALRESIVERCARDLEAATTRSTESSKTGAGRSRRL